MTDTAGKKIAVLTSGGDAPGMNAAVRAVVRVGISCGADVYGIYNGYKGLMEGDLRQFSAKDVSDLSRKGGTVLGSARSKEFMTEEGFAQALRVIKGYDLDGLVVVGGDGSLHGAQRLSESGVKCMGIPASIDNDIAYTDYSIGVDTAQDTIIEAIDKIKDTASSHRRGFVIEVMGRAHGFLALATGVACGAEMVILPGDDLTNPERQAQIVDEVSRYYVRKKPNFICVLAEGASGPGCSAVDILAELISRAGYDCRKTILGHVQRGGTPTCNDRNLATIMGFAATKALLEGDTGKMVGVSGREVLLTPFEDVFAADMDLPQELLDKVRLLSVY